MGANAALAAGSGAAAAELTAGVPAGVPADFAAGAAGAAVGLALGAGGVAVAVPLAPDVVGANPTSADREARSGVSCACASCGALVPLG